MSEVLVGTGYGRTVALRGSTDSLDSARALLPFWWDDSSLEPDEVFDVIAPDAAPLIMRNVEHWMAEHAQGVVFVHAAVVGIDDRALLLPGRSHAGKTTLCAELLRRGATYLSDEYAVIDSTGMVHPYPRPLRIRRGGEQVPTPAASLSATTATEAFVVHAVALLSYDVRRKWEVDEISPARAVLEVLAHTVPARSRMEDALSCVRAAVAGSACLYGSRGSAGDAADPLLTLLRRR